MKKKEYMLFLLLILPLVVGSKNQNSDIFTIIFMELFVSIHMSFFVLRPIAAAFSDNKSAVNIIFWILFLIRAAILIICDLIGFTQIAFYDFVGVFVGGFIVAPILSFIVRKVRKARVEYELTHNDMYLQMQMFCKKCGNKLDPNLKNCPTCGYTSHIYKEN